jgi:Tol biopolymer transport system component
MKKGMLILVLCVFFLSSCGLTQVVEPAATVTVEPVIIPSATVAITPTAVLKIVPTKTPTVKPTPFLFSSLPGWFAYMDFDCNGLCTNLSIIRPDMTDRRVLTDHERGLVLDILWSPDGRYLLFQFFTLGETGFVELHLYDLQSNSTKILTSEPTGDILAISWSPDSRYFVVGYENTDGQNGTIQQIDVQSGALTNLTGDLKLQSVYPAWSPDGTKITFSGIDSNGTTHLWLMDAGGANLKELFADEDYQDQMPAWAPGGGNAAFYRQDSDGNAGLWVMDAAGENPRLMFDMQENKVFDPPVWSPNGQYMALILGKEAKTQVWIYDVLSGIIHVYADGDGEFKNLSWSPDSRALIFLEDKDDSSKYIHLYAPGGDDPFSASGEAFMDFTVWSPVAEIP